MLDAGSHTPRIGSGDLLDACERYLAAVEKARPKEAEWRKLDRLAKKFEPAFRAAFLRAVKAAGEAIPLAPIIRALQAGELNAAVAAAGFPESAAARYRADLTRSLRDVYEQAGQISTTILPAGRSAFAFDVLSTRGLEQLQAHAAERVTAISEQSRDAIRAALVQAREQGMGAQAAARLVRPSIGLLDRHAVAVANRGLRLAAQGFSQSVIDRELASYENRLLQHRAMMIARTEPRIAAVAGQRESWEQAIDQGLFARAELQRRWITVEVERDDADPCPGLDGQTVGLDEPFVHPETGEEFDGPEDTHPHCTCQLELVYDG